VVEMSAEQAFRSEIDWLLGQVRAEVLADPAVRVVDYSYIPWHRESSISFGTANDLRSQPGSPANWTYFMAAQTDAS